VAESLPAEVATQAGSPTALLPGLL